MEAVMRSFQIYKAIEIVVFILGLGLVVTARRSSHYSVAGWGFMLQAALMLVADGFAEARGHPFLHG